MFSYEVFLTWGSSIPWVANSDRGHEEPEEATSADAGPQEQKVRSTARGDFVLGIAVRQKAVGYALLRFRDNEPLQFGLINIRKNPELQQKALEIAAVLRDLRDTAPQKLQRLADDASSDDFAPRRNWNWHVSIDDSTMDRSRPRTSSASASQRAIAMLQGLVIGDCKRLFKAAPSVVHPRRSRLLLGVRALGLPARQEVHELAKTRVHDFPQVTKGSGFAEEQAYLMSDAWASACFTQRAALVAEKRNDAPLVEKLRQRALASKNLQRMREAVAELQPRKAGQELAQVLEARVEKMIEESIHRILDRETGQGTDPPTRKPRKGAAAATAA